MLIYLEIIHISLKRNVACTLFFTFLWFIRSKEYYNYSYFSRIFILCKCYFRSKRRCAKHRTLEYWLKNIHQHCVKLEAKHQERQRLVKALVEAITQDFQKNPLFKCLYKGPYFTGSSFEGLRVKKANEFDVNIVLELPVQTQNAMKICEVCWPSSYTMVQVVDLDMGNCGELNKLHNFLDIDLYLLPQEILSWFQSMVDQLDFKSYCTKFNFEKIKPTNSGPARTLEIRLQDNWISIDLVPVFLLSCSGKFSELTPLNQNIVEPSLMSKCCIVPKPVEDLTYFQVSEETASRLWRIHFPEAEKRILQGRNCLKSVIRLLKRLRDTEKWKFPSYFIKVLAFWCVKMNPEPNYFNESHLAARFIEMLESFADHLDRSHLGHIFFPKFNVLHKISRVKQGQIRDRIRNVLKKIKDNPSTNIKSLFGYSKYKTW